MRNGIDPRLYAQWQSFQNQQTAKKLVEQRKAARAAKVDPNDPIFERQSFEGKSVIPYSVNRKKDIAEHIVPGYVIAGTAWTALERPYRNPRDKYGRKRIKVQCQCGRIKDRRLDSLLQGQSLWCRSCATRYQWQQRRAARET